MNGKELHYFIGRTLQQPEDTDFFKGMIRRLQELWDRRLDFVKGCETEHEAELKEFVWWYKSGCFEEDWAIKQLYDIVVTHKIDLHWFAMEDKLEKSIGKQHVKKVWEIVKRVVLRDSSYLDERYKRLAIKCLKYIKGNDLKGFEEDIGELVNKIGERFGPQAVEDFEEFLG